MSSTPSSRAPCDRRVSRVGQSYTESPTVTIPNVPPGSYFLAVGTDVNAQVAEGNEGNNASGAGVSFAITVQVPDLAVTSTVRAVVGGQRVVHRRELDDRESGRGLARATWIDRLRLSTNSVYDETDAFLTGIAQASNVVAGASYTSSPTVTLPSVAPGSYFLVVATDVAGQVYEAGSEANNSTAMPITITP